MSHDLRPRWVKAAHGKVRGLPDGPLRSDVNGNRAGDANGNRSCPQRGAMLTPLFVSGYSIRASETPRRCR